MSTNIFTEHHEHSQCICFPDAQSCKCQPDERVLHNYSAGTITDPMTAQQRSWCYEQIHRFSEIGYDDEELQSRADQDLARMVLESWVDYVRNKCGYL